MIHLIIHEEKGTTKHRSLIAFLHNEKIVFETQPNDGKPIVSGSLPSDAEIERLFPVNNEWSIEDKALNIGKRMGAKWMRKLALKQYTGGNDR